MEGKKKPLGQTSGTEIPEDIIQIIPDTILPQDETVMARAGDKGCYDYITVLTAKSAINKVFTESNGQLIKTSQIFYCGDAVCVKVDNVEALNKLVFEVQSNPNQCISAGFHAGVEVGEPYHVVTVKQFNDLLDNGSIAPVPESNGVLYQYTNSGNRQYVTTRTKDRMCQSSYLLFDKDDHGSDDFEQWLQDMDEVVPGFASCDKLFVPSSSSRVRANSDTGEPEITKWHCYLKADDPNDLGDFGNRLLTTAHSVGHGSYSDNKNGTRITRCLTDHSVYSQERMIYAGEPTVNSSNHYLDKYRGRVIQGMSEIIDTKKVKYIDRIFQSKAKVIEVRQLDGSTVKKRFKHQTHIDHNALTLDTEITFKTPDGAVGTTSIREVEQKYKSYVGEDSFKLRCQIPSYIRESSSWNGILNFDTHGELFLFDNGTQTIYKAGGRAAEAFAAQGIGSTETIPTIEITSTDILPILTQKLIKNIERAVDKIKTGASEYLDKNVIIKACERSFYSADKHAIYALNPIHELIQISKSDIHLFSDLFGQVFDYAGLEHYFKDQGITTDDEMEKLIGQLYKKLCNAFYHHLMIYCQRSKFATEIDLFALKPELIIEVDRVVHKDVHKQFEVPPIDIDILMAINKDYRQHFTGFDEFLELLLASRVASDRRHAFYSLKAISDWGKGFLAGVLTGLGIVVELSVQEIEKATVGAPFGKDASMFKRQWVLLVDEFKSPKGDLKLLNSQISYSPKNQLSHSSKLYMKLFTYAEEIDALHGEFGVEAQFANRFSNIEVNAETLDSRMLFKQYGKSLYRRAVVSMTADYLNRRVDELRAMGRDAAAKWGDAFLEHYHAAHRIDLGNTLSDGINRMANDLVELIRETMRLANSQFDHIQGGSELGRLQQKIVANTSLLDCGERGEFYFVKSVASVIDAFLNANVTRSEITKISHKRNEIAIAADYENKSYKNTRVLPKSGLRTKGLLIKKEATVD
jgi:hypothetical protein